MLQHNLPVYLNTKDQDGDTYDVEHSLIYKINECTNIIQFWCTDYNYIINMMFYIYIKNKCIHIVYNVVHMQYSWT